MMPARSAGSRPMRASRRVASRREKPQSSSRRVGPASTTSPLPSLPLPSDAKRTTLPPCPVPDSPACQDLLQLRVQKRQYLPRRLGLVRLTFLAEHLDLARVFLVLDLHSVLLRRPWIGAAGFPEHQLGKEALVPLATALRVLLRIDVADKEYPLGTVAILDRKADPIECESDPAPCAIERLIDFKRGRSVLRADHLGAFAADLPGHLCLCLRFLHAKTHHEPAQELRLQLGIGRTRLPHRVILAIAGVDLLHAAVT